MHVAFLQDLAVVMMVAGLVTVVFHRLKQPVVLGYIIAGVIIGPHTPPFPLIHDQQTIQTLAELGIVFLLFSLGLEFNLRKLKEVGVTALLAALLEILLMIGAGYQAGRWFGWSPMDSLFLGAMLSISSTTIIVKALGDLGLSREPFARLIFGILILEDLLAIAMIALLSGIAMTGSLNVVDVGITLGRLGIFLVTTLVLGLIAVPRFLGFVGRFKRNEMLLVAVLGLCFGCSLLADKLGYSVALGAFVIGAIIAEAREIGRIERLIEPVRDMFSAVFFVAIGLLINPKLLVEYAVPIAAISVLVIGGKIVACAFGTFVAGHDTKTSLRVGMGLAQIGEFSFIIAALGVSLKVTSDFLYPIAVAVSAITTFSTPYLIRSTDCLVGWFDRVAPRALVDYLSMYTRWVGHLGTGRKVSFAAKLVRKWTLQMSLNLTLIAAIFIGATFLARKAPEQLPEMLRHPQAYKSLLWLAAVVVALPLFIATFRKLQALGLLVAEVKVTPANAGESTEALRSFVAQAVPLGGLFVLLVFGFTFSGALLPPFRVLLALLVVVAILTWLLWPSSIRVYSKAQFALSEALSQQPHEKPPPAPAGPIAGILREANLATIVLKDDSPGARRLIRELALRTRTGASVVGIERTGGSIINPGPDEELLPGDQVLLLGKAAQLEAARQLLGGSSAAAAPTPEPAKPA